MFPVKCEELRINHLIPLLIVTMHYTCCSCDGQIILRTSSDVFVLQFGVAFLRVVLRDIIFEGPNHVWRALKTSILNTCWHPPVLHVVWWKWDWLRWSFEAFEHTNETKTYFPVNNSQSYYYYVHEHPHRLSRKREWYGPWSSKNPMCWGYAMIWK